MTAWIIEPAISLSLFYLAYLLFLKKVAFFRANRYYLLTAILFSLLLPHISFSSPVGITSYSFFIQEVSITGETQNPAMQETGRWQAISRILLAIYLAVAIMLALRLIWRLIQLYKLVAGNNTGKFNKTNIVSLDSDQAPFSFLNYIFINEALYGERERQKIIEHELVHISQYHTLDILILELLTVIQWFNPVSWMYRRSMIEIHEYLADEEVIKSGTSIPFYQSLLLNLQMGREYFSPANNFNKSLTLNRIKMMTTIKPASWKRIRFLILLPAIVLLALMCTKNEEEKRADTEKEAVFISPEGSTLSVPDRAVIGPDGILRSDNGQKTTEESTEIYFIVEEMPDFQGGGLLAFRDYISENVRYPQAAAENGIEGRVFVQFVVKKDGTVSDAIIVRGVDPSLDEEALRVVRSSPRWEPGRQSGQAVNVAFTFPINFALTQE